MNRRRSTPYFSRPKTVVGHRGASAYAPEHTIHAYELALQQGADAVEQDLHVTKDGELVCLHDMTLERTTNVRHVFPERGRDVLRDGRVTRQWLLCHFPLHADQQAHAGAGFGGRV